jgi:hypothetical protein
VTQLDTGGANTAEALVAAVPKTLAALEAHCSADAGCTIGIGDIAIAANAAIATVAAIIPIVFALFI